MSSAMTDAIPLMEADGTTGRNAARDIRTQLLGAFFLPDSVGFGVRPGFIPRRYSGTDFVDLKAIQLGSPGQAVQIFPGKCVVVRTGQGPYLLSQESTVSNYALDAADPSNPRIDLIYVRLYDKAIGDSGGGPHGPYIEHVNGTPAGSPVAPSAPTDALPLARILRPAATNNVTSGNITDLRKGTQLLGTPRIILPGDALADVGIFPSERRMRVTPSTLTALGVPPFLVDVWGADSVWHGTEALELDVAQSGSGTVSSGTSLTVASVAIPDPGFPYYIKASGAFGWTVVAASIAGRLAEGAITVDSTVYTTNRLSAGYGVSDSIGAGFTQSTINISERKSASYTGTHTVRLIARNTTSPAADITVPASGPDTMLAVTVVPA